MPARRTPAKNAERQQDAAIEGSFPASDPPANSGIVGPKRNHGELRRGPPHERGDDARTLGTPTHDRHATETAHVWEDEEKPPPQR